MSTPHHSKQDERTRIHAELVKYLHCQALHTRVTFTFAPLPPYSQRSLPFANTQKSKSTSTRRDSNPRQKLNRTIGRLEKDAFLECALQLRLRILLLII